MRDGTLVRDTLGEHVFEWFLANKVNEWNEYKAYVTGFEIERYLPRL
jgi:glutamine synthetase